MEAQFASLQPAFAVLAAFGKIIPQRIIDLFSIGIINIHPSLLPRYRGSTPIESAILNGDTETGVSLMQIVAEMDAGPVYAQIRLPLNGAEQKQELYEKLSTLGAQSLISNLPQILDGTHDATAQNVDIEQVSFSKTIAKTDGQIDWQKPAIQLEREVRAYLGWPGSSTTLFDRDIRITKARVIDESGVPGIVKPGKELIVYCGMQALQIEGLKPAGKREMMAHEFLAGIR
jgi:methionyl-tRNA formyltransferase